MYGSQFDGAAAFSGGGFMPSQTTQIPDSSFSSSKSRDVQALFPLTVKQISNALMPANERTEFLIDGVDVNNVKLVGIMCDRVGRVTDVTFVLDDGTGRIDCNKWFHEAVDTSEMDGIVDGTYVCIHGRLKSFQGKRTLNVFSIRPVEDYNEIACHFIECIYVHFYNNRARKQQGSSVNPQVSSLNPHPQMTSSMNQTYAQYSNDGSKSTEIRVLEALNHPAWATREEGVPLDFIMQQVKVPRDRLMMVIEDLVKEGSVYSTIDESHFKSTLNG